MASSCDVGYHLRKKILSRFLSSTFIINMPCCLSCSLLWLIPLHKFFFNCFEPSIFTTLSFICLLFVFSVSLQRLNKGWSWAGLCANPRWPSNSSQMNPSAFDLFMSKGQWNEFLWHQIPPCRKLEQNLFNFNRRIFYHTGTPRRGIVPFARSASLWGIRASVPYLIGLESYCYRLTPDPFNILMEGCVRI